MSFPRIKNKGASAACQDLPSYFQFRVYAPLKVCIILLFSALALIFDFSQSRFIIFIWQNLVSVFVIGELHVLKKG